ncbi:uncharacterized protein HMPREF1541_10255 [Cyphellophora europaea CBS 101466]|uniref:Transcription factor domain-containing protein n=1 Tax=Cyphellophora europaea (strain CBS 101466) TaxID=1220924 RepID=W2S7H7_CYPE1|nr:uncharacterized protein HMPREF1541_10255 [Cyphellophora europaea CBS 101466]ETN44585.1 hypothetical protein HMPREF1541_10255 [Cyphellophora europaea CBS 101466]
MGHRRMALRAMLANAAAHQLCNGGTSDSTFMLAQRKAIKAQRLSLEELATYDAHLPNRGEQGKDHNLPSALDDDAIVASLFLLGPEIIHPTDEISFSKTQSLLKGACFLVSKRHEYFTCKCSLDHPARLDPCYKLESPLFQHAVRTLAYTDIMCCVPCAKAPILDKSYWLDEAIKATRRGAEVLRPDIDLGYCAHMFSILGYCTSAIDQLYRKDVSAFEFNEIQETLSFQLDQAVRSIPDYSNVLTTVPSTFARESAYETERLFAHDGCVTAAICHGLANRIFLLRATNHEWQAPEIYALCCQLSTYVSRIPVDSAVVAIMLWPIWVLGCESYTTTPDLPRERVATLLEVIYEHQRMKNVLLCLGALKQKIWSLASPDVRCASGLGTALQSSWVQYCWQNGIRLLLA